MTDSIKDTIAEGVNQAPKAKRSDKPPVEKPAGGRKRSRTSDDMPYDTSFPDDCPVEPLGINGDDVYFLDQKRQLRVVKSDKLNQGTIAALFCESQDLKYGYWPRYGKPDAEGNFKLIGWRPEQARDALFAEASRRGLWDILDRVRGPGAWRDEDDRLVMHCGDILFHGENTLTPRQVGRHVYPSAPPKPRPFLADEKLGKRARIGVKEAEELLNIFKSWNWRRPEVDPHLLLGWMAAAILGGAIDWRPLIWITGDKATGKSTLHNVIKNVIGPGGMISATDATAAGIWQTVGHSALPVAIDEIEAEVDNRKSQNVIKLARQACSAGQTLRGGSDHQSSTFTVRNCFLFSSILIPPLLGQDVSRMAVLQLEKLGDGSKLPALNPRRLAEIGAILRGRLLREWPRLQVLIDQWKAQLATVGHGGRGGDQFGTLLACYELLTSDHAPDTETLEKWASALNTNVLAECEDDISDHQRCLSFLMTSQLDTYKGGERRTVGSWVRQAAGLDKEYNSVLNIDVANKALMNCGMKVFDKMVAGKASKLLMIANSHQGLAALFKDSHWSGLSGTNGVWVQALRRVQGSAADEQRFNGIKVRCTGIPVDQFMEGGHD